jgi:hypothetical protein
MFKRKLINGLIFLQHQKVINYSLGNIYPLKYLIENLGFSAMLWTYTNP